MAADPEGRETRISSQFLTEHEDSLAKQNPFERESWPSYFQASDSIFGFGSAFSSPVESEFGSTEIESDKDDAGDGDDDYTAELTRRMAQYMLQDDESNLAATSSGSEKQGKSWGLSGSPISTLWSPLGSSYGSPEGPSMEPSPPTTPVVDDGRGWDISHSVVNKLEKMDVSSDGPATARPRFLRTKDSSDEQIRARKGHKRQQQQLMKQQRGAAMAAKPSNSGPMKPVFAGGSSGTGVFLPRHVNYNRQTPAPIPAQPEKKKGCSTVLIPIRVLQALQLHYNRMDANTRQKIVGFQLNREAVVGGGAAKSEQKAAAAPGMSQSDMGLPQEWTY